MTYKQAILATILVLGSASSGNSTEVNPIVAIHQHPNAFQLSPNDINTLTDAIFLAEGGEHTSYPYGIKSIRVKNATEAREVCRRTIINCWGRFLTQRTRGRDVVERTTPRHSGSSAMTTLCCFKVSEGVARTKNVGNNTKNNAKAAIADEFVSFLADRYCPRSCDEQGNVNWKKNVKYFISHAKTT